MNWYKRAQQKILYIMRGLPGSGKSRKAKQLVGEGIIFSTDDFWGDDYDYDANRAAEAHMWNQTRAVTAMAQGISPIVIDNTNVEAWEPKPYVEAAIKRGYQIEFVESDAPWKDDVHELSQRNAHGVSLDRIQEMHSKWHPNLTVDDVINSEHPS